MYLRAGSTSQGAFMITPSVEQIERLKTEWTDQFVMVSGTRPELQRFAGRVGRVVTVNFTGKALVDFADGAWYDITASSEFLNKITADEAKGKYDPKVNSAQAFPAKGG